MNDNTAHTAHRWRQCVTRNTHTSYQVVLWVDSAIEDLHLDTAFLVSPGSGLVCSHPRPSLANAHTHPHTPVSVAVSRSRFVKLL